jgi:hypothetical protein
MKWVARALVIAGFNRRPPREVSPPGLPNWLAGFARKLCPVFVLWFLVCLDGTTLAAIGPLAMVSSS